MQSWGLESSCGRIPCALALAAVGLVSTAGSAPFTGSGGELATAAALLFLGDVRRRSGLTPLVGWLLGGSLLGAALGYVATVWFTGFPLATEGGVGLGIALGGGLGVVSNLVAADARDGDVEAVESMTVDMDADDSPSPRPADLFDGHPDPILYVADEGHGPVVRAANDAFTEAFGVPADAINGTPLDEALMATDDATGSSAVSDIVDAAAAGERFDTVLACQTRDGETRFRIRTAGRGADGYVIYTPADSLA